MSTWNEKYRPKKYEDIRGQDHAVQQIKDFVSNFYISKLSSGRSSRQKKAIILHGPPGSGKTTLAHIAALETNAEIFELNASDFRSKTTLDEILKPAIEQQTLAVGKKNKIILVDEVDGISKEDRGGLPELIRLIESTNYPVIITANDIWNKKFSALRRISEVVKLNQIDYKTIKDILIQLLRKEGQFVDNDILTSISVKARGDVRAAINDLQAVSKTQGTQPIALDERNTETDIFNALKMIFKGKPSIDTLSVLDSVNLPLDQIFLWLEENIPKEYQGEELARAYEFLAEADLFKGRIYKQQYWRFLVYENIFLSYGISSAKRSSKTGFTSYKKPDRILKIWMNNQRIAKKKSISEKYAKLVHVGSKRALREFPVIKNIISSNPTIQKELRLTEDEIVYLQK
jgi:replication factor C large subunit